MYLVSSAQALLTLLTLHFQLFLLGNTLSVLGLHGGDAVFHFTQVLLCLFQDPLCHFQVILGFP